jgi:hypothetical protein
MTHLDPAQRVRCACCGYPTLEKRGEFEICKLCWWEDDGQTDPEAEEIRGGPNHGHSLAQARRNFRRYLVMYEPEHDRRICGGDSETERAAKQTLIEAFQQLENARPQERSLIVAEIRKQERLLQQEMKRKIREHDAQVRRSATGPE